MMKCLLNQKKKIYMGNIVNYILFDKISVSIHIVKKSFLNKTPQNQKHKYFITNY